MNVGNIRSFRVQEMIPYAGARPITVTWLTITDLGGRRSRARKPTSRGTELLTRGAAVCRADAGGPPAASDSQHSTALGGGMPSQRPQCSLENFVSHDGIAHRHL
jgi:hypothetical protein